MSRFMERWQAAGEWTIDLGAEAPWLATGTPGEFDWLVITPNWTPETDVDTLFNLSCYSGFVTGRKRTVGGGTTYSGYSLWALWGDPDGKGARDSNIFGDGSDPRDLETDLWIAGTDGLFNTTDDWTNGITPGTVYSSFSTTLGLIPMVFSEPRSGANNVQVGAEAALEWGPVLHNALRWWFNYQGYEDYFWRINADRSADVGPEDELWRDTPAVLILPGNITSQEENGLYLFGSPDLSYEEDYTGFASGACLFYSDGSGGLSLNQKNRTGITNPPWSYKGVDGASQFRMVAMEIDNSLTIASSQISSIQNNMLRESVPVYTLRGGIEATPAMHTFMQPGDKVWVFADSLGLVDTDNQVQARGESLSPVKYPLLELDRPVQSEMGVYLIQNDPTIAPNRVIDLTPWVEYGDDVARFEVGPAIKRRLSWYDRLRRIKQKSNY